MVEIYDTISREAIEQLPRVQYSGEIIIIDQIEEVDAAVAELRRYKIIGFDTETKPSFKRGVTNKVSLLQLSTGNSAYLFRLNMTGIPASLQSLLADESIKKIGISVRDDEIALNRREKVVLGGFVDLQEYVTKMGIHDLSLQKIYALLFNERISKSKRISNWEVETFSESQKEYAAIDAWATLRIFSYLEDLRSRNGINVIQRNAEESIAEEG